MQAVSCLAQNILVPYTSRHTGICLSTTSRNHTVKHFRGTDKTIDNKAQSFHTLKNGGNIIKLCFGKNLPLLADKTTSDTSFTAVQGFIRIPG